MNPLSSTDCHLKSTLQWDWENLISFGSSTTEIPRKLKSAEWEMDGTGGFDSVSLCSTSFANSGSDLGYPGFSKSSESNSICSSLSESKTYKFASEDLCGTGEFAKPIGSFGSVEPILGLRLGKRTYFAGNTEKASTFPVTPLKRSKSVCQRVQTPRCQVEGCDLDLSSAKYYHRKHRVCENHSKCPKVIVGGAERRFCQQCSRFHGLSEFDEKKRSCRRRLLDHNARRRKLQPETVQPSSRNIYDGKKDMSPVWNGLSLVQTRNEEKFLWESSTGSKSEQPIGLMLKPAGFDCFDGQLLFDRNRLPDSIPVPHGSSGFLPSKSKFTNTVEILSKDIEEFAVSSNQDGTRELHRALSLLSTTSSSWGSCDSKHASFDHPTNKLGPLLHSVSQPSGHRSSEYWRTEQYPSEPMTSPRDSGNQFQEIQLFKAPYERYFRSDRLT